MARLIEAIERDYNEMAAEREASDPESLLDQIRTRPRQKYEPAEKVAVQQHFGPR